MNDAERKARGRAGFSTPSDCVGRTVADARDLVGRASVTGQEGVNLIASIETRGDDIGDLVKLLNNVIMKFSGHV